MCVLCVFFFFSLLFVKFKRAAQHMNLLNEMQTASHSQVVFSCDHKYRGALHFDGQDLGFFGERGGGGWGGAKVATL